MHIENLKIEFWNNVYINKNKGSDKMPEKPVIKVRGSTLTKTTDMEDLEKKIVKEEAKIKKTQGKLKSQKLNLAGLKYDLSELKKGYSSPKKGS